MAVSTTPEAAEDRSRRSHGAVHQAVQWGVLLLPVALLVVAAWQHRWTFDDGFINFRIVRQLEAGNGPVFNIGQRVETYTSALWLFALTIGDLLLPVRLEHVSVILGILGTAAGLTAASVGAARLSRCIAPTAFLVPAGTLAVAALAPFWYFTTSGLEGGLTYAWLGITFFLAVRWARRREPPRLWEAAVIGLGWLIRPELVILTVLLAATMLVLDRAAGWKQGVRTLVAVAAVPLAYQLFRMGYFGVLVPNTAIAKEASATNWQRGWDYLTAFSTNYQLWLPVLALAVGIYLPLLAMLRRAQLGRELAVAAVFVVGAVACTVYIVRVGGDYVPARLLLPALFMFLAPVAVVPATRTFGAASIVIVWALAALVVDRPNVPYGTGFQIPPRLTLEEALQAPVGSLLAKYQFPGVWIRGKRLPARPGPDATDRTIDESGIGGIGYAMPLDVLVLDQLGLADPMTSHLELTRPGVPGHEKPIPGTWVVARLTAPGSRVDPALVDTSTFVLRPLIAPSHGAAFDRQVAIIRQVLQCPAVKQFQASYRAPMSLDRFLTNVVHSVGNTTLRIPPDAEKARRELC